MSDPTIQSILKKQSAYGICGSLWMECDGERFFGPGRMELLEKIETTGSINKAAKEMGMSYKKAWDMINALNRQSRTPLVITQSGGEKGGGSIITEEARQLMKYHQALRDRFKAFLQKETEDIRPA